MSNRVPDVFISYSSNDREWVSVLAQALKSNNYRVWWDQELVGGQNFHEDISATLDQSRCVVVVWSENSIVSDWVQGEADQANERGVLVPITCRPARVPTAFRSLHTINFHPWNGGDDERCFQELAKAIEYKIHDSKKFKPQGISQKIMKTVEKGKSQRGCSVAITVTLSLFLLLPGLFWYQNQVAAQEALELAKRKEEMKARAAALAAERKSSERFLTKAERKERQILIDNQRKAYLEVQKKREVLGILYRDCTNEVVSTKLTSSADTLTIETRDSSENIQIPITSIPGVVDYLVEDSAYGDESVRDCMNSHVLQIVDLWINDGMNLNRVGTSTNNTSSAANRSSCAAYAGPDGADSTCSNTNGASVSSGVGKEADNSSYPSAGAGN